MTEMDEKIIETARIWTKEPFDEETRRIVSNWLENDPKTLTDAFYTHLEFGTGGMRGIMAPGTNRMNVYTISMATQGLANYLNQCFAGQEIKVVIAYDCRNNNLLFASTTANVLTANGIRVFLFDGMRPTPELSFAVRYLKCQSGIVITASHNPKEYNGYKVYWDDGAQLVAPHDKNVIAEVLKIKSIAEVKTKGNPEMIEKIGKEVDEAFLSEVKKQLLNPDIAGKEKIRIVYTPLHGTGGVLIPAFLKSIGYENVIEVKEQMVPDGNFSATRSSNPEEAAAMELSLEYARKFNADLIMATDPDADRIGLAVKDSKGEFVLLNGNQTGALIVRYILDQWKTRHRLSGNEMTVKTIVTSELLKDISLSYGVKQYDVLTGFKWIADVVRNMEGKEKFIVGLEESYGYMIGDFVRDKDSVTSAAIIAEMAVHALQQGKTLFDMLMDIYLEYGLYREGLVNIHRPGKSGQEEIAEMMDKLRKNPPAFLGGEKVIELKDYHLQKCINMIDNQEQKIDLPRSNVLQFLTEGGSKISARPSGTEPKIKFYISVKEKLNSKADYPEVNELLRKKIEMIKKELGIA
ncbi:MAG TPA: phospho-sugar mutase [Bacteroidia bacterium]|nr:phospho-sugar mutase [Bacteroidia bacterium]HRS58522.1 phospho-sugar mutase [Bacteroidia bacterium]HRU69042.1 phospho-sugar mutase [Bacteroidia bacterium]